MQDLVVWAKGASSTATADEFIGQQLLGSILLSPVNELD